MSLFVTPPTTLSSFNLQSRRELARYSAQTTPVRLIPADFMRYHPILQTRHQFRFYPRALINLTVTLCTLLRLGFVVELIPGRAGPRHERQPTLRGIAQSITLAPRRQTRIEVLHPLRIFQILSFSLQI